LHISPYIYEPDKSIDVLKKTYDFLESDKQVKSKIESLGWIYHEVGNIIPQTMENLWSGHSFPFNESWNDLQISCTLSFFGLYKQAFVSLRSGLELGLLSVYYNINDDGHKTVRDWLKSKNTSDANTPRTEKIWTILLSNKNIRTFNEKFDLRTRFNNLNFLNNYVHTKGNKYSNSFGGIKGNSQTFEEDMLNEWLISYEQIIIIIATMHLLKYPLAVIEFNYFRKFGIDMPNFGGLEKSKIEQIASILPEGYMEEIKNIARDDVQTQKTFDTIASMPDLTDDEIEEQIIKIEKITIEHGDGFIEWEKRQYKLIKDIFQFNNVDYPSGYEKTILNRIKILRNWAQENHFLDSKAKRLDWDI
jgi:hypothetical protein